MAFTLWFMGLPAAGKSTLAKRVENEIGDKIENIENLDGDEIRKNLHPDLGFTREEREINNRRTAFICKLLNRNGIVAITGMITPFRDSQQMVRDIIEEEGDFIMVYVKSSVETCAERDPKGLYEKAQAGKIENFTGVNHPFQEPIDPEIIVDTESMDVDEATAHVTRKLHEMGIFEREPDMEYDFDVTRDEVESAKGVLKDLGYIE